MANAPEGGEAARPALSFSPARGRSHPAFPRQDSGLSKTCGVPVRDGALAGWGLSCFCISNRPRSLRSLASRADEKLSVVRWPAGSHGGPSPGWGTVWGEGKQQLPQFTAAARGGPGQWRLWLFAWRGERGGPSCLLLMPMASCPQERGLRPSPTGTAREEATLSKALLLLTAGRVMTWSRIRVRGLLPCLGPRDN